VNENVDDHAKIDWVNARARGGSDDVLNLALEHRSCNGRAGAAMPFGT
jgi:hypothetical protein